MLDSELAGLVRDGQPMEIEGIGRGLAEKISELVVAGRLATLERLGAEIPAGHPTGRLLLVREAYAVDVGQVMEACVEHGVALEANANPHRLDIDWLGCRRAHDTGCRVAINPDLHSIEGIADVGFGVGTARRGWIESGDVLNALSLEELEAERQARL